MTDDTARRAPHHARAEYLGGTRFRFRHDCGHTSTHDYSKGPRARRMGEAACKFMARWWGISPAFKTSGVFAPCPKCYRKVGATWKLRTQV